MFYSCPNRPKQVVDCGGSLCAGRWGRVAAAAALAVTAACISVLSVAQPATAVSPGATLAGWEDRSRVVPSWLVRYVCQPRSRCTFVGGLVRCPGCGQDGADLVFEDDRVLPQTPTVDETQPLVVDRVVIDVLPRAVVDQLPSIAPNFVVVDRAISPQP